MKIKNYLIILFFIVSGALHGQGKFKGGVAATVFASQIDGDQAAGYSKFGGSVQVFTNLEMENYTLQMRMGLSERGSRRNTAKSTTNIPMHLRFRTVDLTLGLNKKMKEKVNLGASVILARRLSATDTEGYINNLDRDSRKNYFLGAVSMAYPLNPHVNIRATAEYSITSIFNNSANSIRYRTGSFFNVLGLGLDYIF